MDVFAGGAISMMRSGSAGSRFSFLGACVLKSNGEQFDCLVIAQGDFQPVSYSIFVMLDFREFREEIVFSFIMGVVWSQ
jgi:hypothetical protein